MSAGVTRPTAEDIITRTKALPRDESDPRPLGARLAQALCDEGFSIDEAVSALVCFAAIKAEIEGKPAVSVRYRTETYQDYWTVPWVPSD